MKRLLAKYLFLITGTLLPPFIAVADNDWAQWEVAFSEVSAQSDSHALTMLEDRYNSLSGGFEKLYVASKLHSFMTLRGQPYHGNRIAFNEAYSTQEQLFISALNAEEQLDFPLAQNNYLQLLSLANKTNDAQGKILFEYHLCRAMNKQGQYSNANVYCNSLKTHLADVEHSLLPRYQATRVIANNFESIGDYQTALEFYQKYLSIIPSSVDPSGVYNDSGLLLMKLGRIEQAIEYLNIALKIRHENNSQLELAQSHHSMGKILLAAKDYEYALYHFTQAQTILVKYQHSYGLTYALLGLGETNHHLKNFDLSYQLLFEALELASLQGNDQIRGEIYLTLSLSHQTQNKYISAKNFAEKAYQLGEKIMSINLMTDALESLALIAESEKKYQDALSYYKRYTKSELSKHTLQQQSAYLALDTQQKEYQQQVNFLKAVEENDRLSSEVKRLNSLNALYLFSIIVLCAIGVAYMWRVKIHTRKAERDHLTGALNRAAAIREIKSMPKLLNHEHKHLLILLDLDDFKRINDNYGHPTGDRALSHVAQIINDNIQEAGLFGRLGGEEFVIVIDEVDELDIVEKVEKLHHAISNTHFEAENKEKLYVTATFSYLATSKCLDDFDELYSILDQALYQAKESGKNCIIDAFNEPIYLPASAYVPVQP
ncbi:diguanylate cyclase [Vibrio sp. TBV020]|uniref:diguanylate cyclase n=1 Tax=Vibrio sp. TBV020 TaxID=3137398 RepID=UPI0038CD1314